MSIDTHVYLDTYCTYAPLTEFVYININDMDEIGNGKSKNCAEISNITNQQQKKDGT
jgi:hypothetical protein